ncbi:MAG: hypothetical protein ACKV0T_22260 [Planctomycetales bacterium]
MNETGKPPETVADADSRPAEMERARNLLARDSRASIDSMASGDMANQEAFVVAALHLLHRKIAVGPQSPIDRAFLEGAAKLFSSLADACEELAASKFDPKPAPRAKAKRPA